MTEGISFAEARTRVVDELTEHYAEKFPHQRLATLGIGRDLGESWAVFLTLQRDDGVFDPLVGAPVIVVGKTDGTIGMTQIPPHFEILHAPEVMDGAGSEEGGVPVDSEATGRWALKSEEEV